MFYTSYRLQIKDYGGVRAVNNGEIRSIINVEIRIESINGLRNATFSVYLEPSCPFILLVCMIVYLSLQH